MKYDITSIFGAKESVRKGVHTGIDLAMPEGTTLRSIIDGRVIQIYDGSGSMGKGVRIMGEDDREYIYGHMNIVGVKVGDIINFGEKIGTSGNTGNSTGPHLHFAVVENGEYINPQDYVPLLQNIIGNNIFAYSERANSREELENLNGCTELEKPPIWDIEGRVDYAVELKKCEIEQEIEAFLDYTMDLLVDLSYSLALIGGGVLIVLRVAGMTRATKYFSVLQCVHIFIRSLLGGTA